MFKKLIGIIKDAFTETEQERIMKEEREKKSATQKEIIETKSCPICGGKSFEKGYIRVSGTGAVAVSNISTYHDDYNMQYDDLVHVCSTCGYVLLFANFETEQQIMK